MRKYYDFEGLDSGAGYEMSTKPQKNVIHMLKLYTLNGLFVFDKPEWETVAEVFVPSATDFIKKFTKGSECTLLFSDKWFPDSHKVVRVEELGFGGTNYYSQEFNHTLWLCSYLNHYYEESPKEIYLQII